MRTPSKDAQAVVSLSQLSLSVLRSRVSSYSSKVSVPKTLLLFTPDLLLGTCQITLGVSGIRKFSVDNLLTSIAHRKICMLLHHTARVLPVIDFVRHLVPGSVSCMHTNVSQKVRSRIIHAIGDSYGTSGQARQLHKTSYLMLKCDFRPNLE